MPLIIDDVDKTLGCGTFLEAPVFYFKKIKQFLWSSHLILLKTRSMEVELGSWFSGLTLRSLAESAQSYAAEKKNWYPGMKGALETLARELCLIDAKYAPIEKLANKQAEMKVWLDQLRGLAFDAEDVLDLLRYEMLESQIDNTNELNCFGSLNIKSSKAPTGNASSLKELKELLLKANCLRNSLRVSTPILTGCNQGNPDPKPTTDPVVAKRVIFGRDKDCEEIIMSLLYPDCLSSNSEYDHVPVVAIVGCGGIGKTTLAQLVYNDKRVRDHFDLHMWVSVSNCFDALNLTKWILRSVIGSVPDCMQDLIKLQDKLREKIASKRFILVIDDVWNDEKKSDLQNQELWRTVLEPLQSGKEGSRIVLTTRVKIIADLLDSNITICPSPLSGNHLWLLFKMIALENEAPDAFPKLQEIGKKIVAKLYGLPLAAISIGNALKSSRKLDKWQATLDRDVFPENLSALMSSYLHLPEHLQRCFAFCGILPKGLMIDSNDLVCMWISHGFVEDQNETLGALELTGNKYITQLVSRSFFQFNKQSGKVYVYITDLLHDLACHVSSKFCGRIEHNELNKIPPTVYHLSIQGVSSMACLESIYKLHNLRTLLISDTSGFLCKSSNLFRALKYLRLLDLKGSNLVNLPERLGELVHLRYLGLCETIRHLPESICKLRHLQVLVIPRKSELNSLPEGMNKLISMRHLKMETKYIAMISGIGTLTCLQELAEFRVKKESGWTIHELRKLRYLSGKLSIKNLQNIGSKEEARGAGLASKGLLHSLTFEWNSSGRNDGPAVDAKVLEGLRPHPNLKELHLSNYLGAVTPNWLVERDTSQLKYLHISNCRMLVNLPSLGQLPFLEILHIRGMSSLHLVGREFYGKKNIAFPALEDLVFAEMPKWAVWSSRASGSAFPSLKRLKIFGCPNLFKIPPCPSAVREVVLERVGDLEHLKLVPSYSLKSTAFSWTICSRKSLHEYLLPEEHLKAVKSMDIIRCQLALISMKPYLLSALKSLRISQCEVTSDQLGKFILNMKPLYRLEIDGCLNLEEFPAIIVHSTSLHELFIRDCSELSSLQAIRDLKSLRSLIIERCRRVTATSVPSLKNLTCLKKLSISSCPALQSLPEDGLPSSLEILHLVGCSRTLTNKLCNPAASDRAIITFIPKVVIL